MQNVNVFFPSSPSQNVNSIQTLERACTRQINPIKSNDWHEQPLELLRSRLSLWRSFWRILDSFPPMTSFVVHMNAKCQSVGGDAWARSIHVNGSHNHRCISWQITEKSNNSKCYYVFSISELKCNYSKYSFYYTLLLSDEDKIIAISFYENPKLHCSQRKKFFS